MARLIQGGVMKNSREGIGRLSAEDIEAIQGDRPQQESMIEAVSRMIAESDKRIDAAEKDAQKAIVLGRAAVIASGYANSTLNADTIAVQVFKLLSALDAEYEKRYGS